MVRRSSLIIAASLAVLSTFEPGSLCFAAAAPAAAAAPVEDRFERPRFLKKEMKRYVYTNSTMTSRQPSKDDQTTTPATLPDVTPPPDVLSASLASLSLLSAEASWSAAHPGIPFGAPLGGDSTTNAAGSPTTNAAAGAATTTNVPAAASTQPPPPGQGESQGSGHGSSGDNNDNNPPATTTHGGQQTGGQETGGQETGGQQTGGQQTGGQQTGGQQTGGQETGGQQPTGKPTGGIPNGGESSPNGILPSITSPGLNGGSQTAEPATGTNAGGVTPGSTPTKSSGGAAIVIPPPASHTDSLIAELSSALAISPPVNPQSVVNTLGKSLASVASPIIIGSTTNPAGIVLPITASTPAESSAGLPPVVVGTATDSNGHVVPILTASLPTGSPSLPVVATGPSGEQNTASVPAQSGSGPALVGSQSAPQATGSAPAVVGGGSSTNAQGQAVPISSGPPSQSSGGASPALVGSTTNSLGQVVPVSSAPPAGSTTNAEGQVVPISSPASITNDRFAHADAIPSSAPSEAAAPGTTQQTGSVEPANTATLGNAQTAASPPPAPSTAGPQVPASSSFVAPLPIATASQSYNTNQNAPLTQLPTASDTMTEQPVASSIELASSSSPTGVTGTVETGLPSGVPLVLYPPTGPVTRPANTELIQIGFLYPLNYDFVWQHEESQRQIFHYLPIGIAYGLSIDLSNVTMQTLRAWDTTEDLHYITTLALAWIPSTLVDSLGLILHTQAEKFYHNPDPAVRTLLSMINPALPIRADNATDGGPESGVGASPSGTANANSGTIANGINNSSPVKASSVGIGVGVVCGAAAYGAAMFFVARRYKKRRQSHLRTPSMYSSPVMSQHGADPAAAAALMSGGMGERSISPYYDNDRGPSRGSGRSGSSAGRQQISAPVMAENSLGWN